MALPATLQQMVDSFHFDRSRFCEGALLGLALGMATMVIARDRFGIAAEMVPAAFLMIALFIVRRSQQE